MSCVAFGRSTWYLLVTNHQQHHLSLKCHLCPKARMKNHIQPIRNYPLEGLVEEAPWAPTASAYGATGTQKAQAKRSSWVIVGLLGYHDWLAVSNIFDFPPWP